MSRVAPALALAAFALMGCGESRTVAESPVGDPCVPEAIPEGGGFDSLETYLETSSVGCATRVCAVFGFAGDPSESLEECEAAGGTDCAGKPLQQEIDDRVYCTCRCATPTSGASTCTCPSGFVCQEILDESAGPGIAGSYCVREEFPAP